MKDARWVCKLCILSGGLSGHDLKNWPTLNDDEAIARHMESVHHTPVRRPHESAGEAMDRFHREQPLAGGPQCRCPACDVRRRLLGNVRPTTEGSLFMDDQGPPRYRYRDIHWKDVPPYSPDEIVSLITTHSFNETEYRLVQTITHLAAQIRGHIIPGSPAQVKATLHAIPIPIEGTIVHKNPPKEPGHN